MKRMALLIEDRSGDSTVPGYPSAGLNPDD
jgi:hypothetical protein